MAVSTLVNNIVVEIRPIIQQAVFFSRIANKEYLLKLLYERSVGRVHVKESTNSFRVLDVRTGKKIRITALPVTEITSKAQAEIVIAAITEDIEMLFKPVPLMEDLGNIELIFKFRDATLVSHTRTEYRQKKEMQANARVNGYNQDYQD